jgi:DNA-binding MarR family transcriptional regulator
MPTRSSPQLPKVNYERLAAFRYQLRRFLRFSEVAAEAVGLTPRQYQGLLAIAGCRGGEEMTVGELAEQLLVAHQSAVGLVDRLCAQGLVKRRPGSLDRRQVLVGLTSRGTALLGKLAYAHQVELRKLGPELRVMLQELERATSR